MAKVIVEFVASWRGYGKEEVAGFEEEVAQSLIDAGRARLYELRKGGKPSTARASKPPKDAVVPKDGPAKEEGAAGQPGPGPVDDEDEVDDDAGKP